MNNKTINITASTRDRLRKYCGKDKKIGAVADKLIIEGLEKREKQKPF